MNWARIAIIGTIVVVVVLVVVALIINFMTPYPSSKIPNRDGTSRLTSAYVTLPDGRVVSCVYGYDGGGVTCDFNHADHN